MHEAKRTLRFRPWITEEDTKAVVDALMSGNLVSPYGKYGKLLEEELTKYLNTRHALAVSSGTTALHLALRAIGVGPGDEVIVPAFTFLATASAVLHSNAVPVFADISLETLGLDSSSVESKISDRTRAIIVVHMAGMPAEMDELIKVAKEHNLYLIEDTAQALGAVYRGVKAGALGDLGTFSFYPTKTITSSEGGAVSTNSSELANRVRLLRSHGETGKYYYEELGYNYRMGELQAALAYSQLLRVEEIIRRKEAFAKTLTEELSRLDNDLLILPKPKPYVRHAWHIYQILLTSRVKAPRDKVVEELKAKGIEAVTVAYPIPLYRTPLFINKIGYGKGCPWSCPFYGREVKYEPLPNTEEATRRIFGILISPYFTEDDAVYAAKVIKDTLMALS
ncbi:DegT/DnrJ/EryC1/StrS family aminotransferase [Caldivirga maquilingensis]|uniref:Glutamine--scyllo-inositol transaminase n=1 Tax=Caldivirga maquilingensis (strain ATCC 700844 / DSM 13496 / JCM 10307 / IC-167) TaxID=397948 RepID=A8MDL2_CALMQ|nr:DegT/DnrJ/EryC1/StrS family aminotransferase [Caldivirga maquilingensis]ABW01868.1 Glutamine--scyllo-inositol transaminase [Caldivirga maquilingensis IC-167]